MQIGDSVSFLDEKGGGKVVAIRDEGRTADVEIEDGFVLRVPASKCVVVNTLAQDPYTIRNRSYSAPAPSVKQMADRQKEREQLARAKAEKQKQIEEKRMQENLAALVGKYKK